MKVKLSVLQFMGLLHAFSNARQIIIWNERSRATRQTVIETATETIHEYCSNNSISLDAQEIDDIREALLRVAQVTDLGIHE